MMTSVALPCTELKAQVVLDNDIIGCIIKLSITTVAVQASPLLKSKTGPLVLKPYSKGKQHLSNI
jgi:hypothetical protein